MMLFRTIMTGNSNIIPIVEASSLYEGLLVEPSLDLKGRVLQHHWKQGPVWHVEFHLAV